MAVAMELGKFEHEVLALSPSEYARWLAYLRIKKQAEEKQRRNKGRGICR